MENLPQKKIKIGFRYGWIMLACGTLMVLFNVAMLYFSNKYFPKMLAVGLAIAVLSPIFFLFPGAAVEKMPEGKEMNKVFWRNAPGLHKAMWIIWGIISVAIAFFALISFDPDFYQ